MKRFLRVLIITRPRVKISGNSIANGLIALALFALFIIAAILQNTQ